MYLDMYLDMLGIHVSEIETSPVPELTLVLMKIDLRQADNSGFLVVNHSWQVLGCATEIPRIFLFHSEEA